MVTPKRVPYGVSDFRRVILEDQYYVDKTMYIPLLEAQPDYLIFIRPRRFGKSLFLSMLEYYYDCNQKENFDALFGNLWIGSQPTPLQGQFQVLTLDFSQVGGDFEHLEERFNSYCGICLDAFINYYSDLYEEEVKEGVYATNQSSEKLAIIRRSTVARGCGADKQICRGTACGSFAPRHYAPQNHHPVQRLGSEADGRGIGPF